MTANFPAVSLPALDPDAHDAPRLDDGRWRVRVLDKIALNHNVDRWLIQKPAGYTFTPGQATELTIDRPGMRDAPRPFSFTDLPGRPALEFVIKRYPTHDGVTDELSTVTVGDTLLLDEPFGAIGYRGQGVFIAGGAGLTPFLAIFRELQERGDLPGHRLVWANETPRDLFMKRELDTWFGKKVIYTVDQEPNAFTHRRKIDLAFLREQLGPIDGPSGRRYYVCGPPGMGSSLKEALLDAGVPDDRIVHEDWS